MSIGIDFGFSSVKIVEIESVDKGFSIKIIGANFGAGNSALSISDYITPCSTI